MRFTAGTPKLDLSLYNISRPPKHKYSARMAEPSVWEPLGVHDFDSAINHGGHAFNDQLYFHLKHHRLDRPEQFDQQICT